jgi:hypothetical protein
MHTIMHLLPSVAIQPNLESKTRPKQLLGSLPLGIALHGVPHSVSQSVSMRDYYINIHKFGHTYSSS